MKIDECAGQAGDDGFELGHFVDDSQSTSAPLTEILGAFIVRHYHADELSINKRFDKWHCYGDLFSRQFIVLTNDHRRRPPNWTRIRRKRLIPGAESPTPPSPPEQTTAPSIVISSDSNKQQLLHDFSIIHVHLTSGRLCKFCREKVPSRVLKYGFQFSTGIKQKLILNILSTDLAAGSAAVHPHQRLLSQKVHPTISGSDVVLQPQRVAFSVLLGR